MNVLKLFVTITIFSGYVYSSYNPVFLSNPKVWNNVLNNPTYKESIIHMNEWKKLLERKVCGESLKHIGGLLVDKTDKDSKVIVEGSIRTNKLILKLGCVKEKEIYIKNILLPIETISSKCINIRQKIQEESTILCLQNKFLRNFWINSITDAILCHETKVKGKLPQYKYSEDVENNEIKEEEEQNKEIKEEKEEEENKEIKEEKEEEENKEIKEIKEIKEEKEEETNETTEENNKEINEEKPIEIIKEENKNESSENIINKDEKKSTEITNNKNVNKLNEDWKQNILKEEFEDEIEKNEEQKGLKLRIAKSKYGHPKIKINGTDIQEIKNKNKSPELRSTNIEDNENLTNLENNDSEEIEE